MRHSLIRAMGVLMDHWYFLENYDALEEKWNTLEELPPEIQTAIETTEDNTINHHCLPFRSFSI